jgi:ElaB/YqjD/DUF883 family membrane-anchored ribosome-binding protein
METSVNNVGKQGQSLIDKTSEKADELRDAAPMIRKAAGQAQAIGKQGIDTITDAASRVSKAASNASDSIVAYTKKNPATALAIAAASGALLYALIKALTPRRG